MKFIKMVFFLIVFLCGVVFFIQNSVFITEKIALQFDLFGTKWASSPIPLYVYVLSAFALGAIVSFLYLLGEKLRLGAEVKSLRARVRQLEDELSQGVEEEESEEREVEEG
ncbi:hypothetical protein JCM13304A_14670 [Desulfothermus okinawensis JCM 13304]